MSAADCLEQMVATVAGEDSRAGQRARRRRTARRRAQQRRLGHGAPAQRSDAPAGCPCRRPAAPIAGTRPHRARRSQGDHARAHRAARQPGAHGGRAHDQDRRARPGIEIRGRPFARAGRADRAIQKRLFELEHSVDIRGVAARHKLHAVATRASGFRLAGNGPVQRSAVAHARADRRDHRRARPGRSDSRTNSPASRASCTSSSASCASCSI